MTENQVKLLLAVAAAQCATGTNERTARVADLADAVRAEAGEVTAEPAAAPPAAITGAAALGAIGRGSEPTK